MKKNIILVVLLIVSAATFGQVTPGNIGVSANTLQGDGLRTFAGKVNNNDFLLDLKGTAAGTDTYTATISVPSPGYTTGITAISSYVTGQRYFVTFTNANTGAATLNINSIGAKNIRRGNAALAAGDIVAGQVVELIYDGTNLQIIGDGGVPSTRTVNSQPLSSDITLTKSNIGLSNVDNTSDANKPVSTAQQTALDLKIDDLIAFNRQTSSYTLALADAVRIVEMNSASANNLTVPLNSSVAFPIGTQILVAQYGAGQTTFVPTGGVTIRSDAGKLKITAQYGAATLVKVGTDEWYLFGNLTN